MIGVIRRMKSIKWTLLATAALASLACVLTLQQQDVAAQGDRFVYNHHDHTIISENQGILGNEGTVTSEEDSHYNFNDNTNREDRIKCNSHSIPANTGGEGTIPCY